MIRLAIRVRRADAELVLAELLELAPSGVEELEVDAGLIEYAVYGAPGELPDLPDLRAAAGSALIDVSTTEIADDWSERWRSFHRPVLIEPPARSPFGVIPALYVRPPWEPPSDQAGVKEIVIDPGQAFGTGAHATTRLCLELLLELMAQEQAPAALLDVGAGSGVLAIAAAQLGFSPVLALDHERESVTAMAENALANGVELQVRHFDLRTDPLPWIDEQSVAGAVSTVESLVVMANLLRPLLLDLARTMTTAPAHLLASGLLREEADEVAGAFAERLGMREHARRERGEWAALWLARASIDGVNGARL